MALERLCGFCYEPLSGCVCPEPDEPVSAPDGPGEDDVEYHVGGDAPMSLEAMTSGLTVRRTAAEGARAVAERKLALLRRAVRAVLDDRGSGLGPNAAAALRNAMRESE